MRLLPVLVPIGIAVSKKERGLWQRSERRGKGRESLGAVCGLLLAGLLGLATPASAESFGNVSGGLAVTSRGDVSVSSGLNFRTVTFGTSGAVGGRGAYWVRDFEDIGFGLDVLHDRPDIGSQTVRTDAVPETVSLPDRDLRVTARPDMSVSIVVGIAGMLLWIVVTLAMAVRSAPRRARRRVRTLLLRHRRPKMPQDWARRQ